MTDADVRETVRAHYAQAATAVLAATGRTTLPIVDAQCCTPAAAGDEVATCCAGDAEVGAVFGPDLYSAAEQGELPAAAVAASLGCGNPMMVAELQARARGCSTSARAAASTCCSRPVESARPGSPTAST